MSSEPEMAPALTVTGDLTELDVPFLVPERVVPEFFRSRIEQKDGKSYPEWDQPRMTPALKLVAAQRELEDMSHRLHEKREQQQERRKDLDEQWRDLREKAKSFREAFITFDQFSKDNKTKRERAEKKLKELAAHQEKRRKEMESMSKKIERMKEMMVKMEESVREHQIYKDYMQKAVELFPQFNSIYDIIRRYECLKMISKSLVEEELQMLRTMTTESVEEHCAEQEYYEIKRELDEKVNELKKHHMKTKDGCFEMKRLLRNLTSVASQHVRDYDEVKATIRSMYGHLCEFQEADLGIELDDTEVQLVEIKQTMEDLQVILRLVRQRSAHDIATTVTQCGTSVKRL